jgi:hypothetical protein
VAEAFTFDHISGDQSRLSAIRFTPWRTHKHLCRNGFQWNGGPEKRQTGHEMTTDPKSGRFSPPSSTFLRFRSKAFRAANLFSSIVGHKEGLVRDRGGGGGLAASAFFLGPNVRANRKFAFQFHDLGCGAGAILLERKRTGSG